MNANGTIDIVNVVLLPDSGIQFVELGPFPLSSSFDQMRGRWWPLPFLRDEKGPTNWCRLWVTAAPGRAEVILAFDTSLVAETPADAAPTAADVGQTTFRLAEKAALDAFLGTPWVNEWLSQGKLADQFRLFLAAIPALQRSSVSLTAQPPSHEIPIQLTITLATAQASALIVDGNHMAQLEMRDLSRPHQRYTPDIPWSVEFTQADFGDRALSRRSGRFDAFQWPSPVRIGQEAERLARLEWAKTWATGQGYPLRHLADNATHAEQWRLNPGDHPVPPDDRGRLPVGGAFLRGLGSGCGLGDGDSATPRPLAQFSRASMTTFFFAELLTQAHTWVNSWEYRHQCSFRPLNDERIRRRISHVVVVPPAGMTKAELDTLFCCANEAAGHLWPPLHQGAPPAIVDGGDAAVVAQDNYLNNKGRGFLVDLLGRQRNDRQTLRIATLDVDLLWSSLTIATHATGPDELDIDLILRCPSSVYTTASRVIERIILPEIASQPNVFNEIIALFGPRRPHPPLVARWVARHVLAPAAMQAVEEMSKAKQNQLIRITLPQTQDQASPFSEITFSTTAKDLDQAVCETLKESIKLICDIIRQHRCDILLISGMAAHWPTIRTLVHTHLPVLPSRIVVLPPSSRAEQTLATDDRPPPPLRPELSPDSVTTLPAKGIEDATFDLSEVSRNGRDGGGKPCL